LLYIHVGCDGIRVGEFNYFAVGSDGSGDRRLDSLLSYGCVCGFGVAFLVAGSEGEHCGDAAENNLFHN